MKKLLMVLMVVFLAACTPREDEVLRVGMDLRFPPFETEVDGEPVGISVDVALALGEYLGRPVEIINTNFASLIPSLNSGEIDIIIASMSNTPERAEAINFSSTYFYFKIPSLVNRQFAEANGITENSTTDDLLALGRAGANFTGITGQISSSIPESLGLPVEIATNLEAAILNVVQGQADVLIMSTFPVTRGHLANPEDTIIVWSPWVSSPIGMGVRQGEDELLAQANEFIATMNQPGGLYDELRTKWSTANLNPADWEEAVLFVLERFGLDFFIDED
jgi:polar amino acid transport system substrate-binding protein